MAIKNLANYKVGQIYKLKVERPNGISTVVENVKVLEKGDKKLKLDLLNGKIDWFDSSKLTSTDERVKANGKKSIATKKIDIKLTKMAQKPVAKITETVRWIKAVSKPELSVFTLVQTGKLEYKNLTLEQKAKYWELSQGNFRRDLRQILQKKGLGLRLSQKSVNSEYLKVVEALK